MNSDGSAARKGSAWTVSQAIILVIIMSVGSTLASHHPLADDGVRITAGSPASFDNFGSSVSIDGPIAAVGVPGDDDAGKDRGSVYIYEQGGGRWRRTIQLFSPDEVDGQRFGSSVAVSGDFLMVGAPGGSAPAVHIFEKQDNAWTWIDKFVSGKNTGFGYSVQISANLAVVGAPRDMHAGPYSGIAYLYEHIAGNWTQVTRLVASDAGWDQYFGVDVAVTDGTVVVGAHWDGQGGTYSGAAYVFEEVGGEWRQAAKLKASDQGAEAYFGSAVAVSDGRVLVGAGPHDHSGLQDAGAAYVFEEQGDAWAQTQRLTPSDPERRDYFGSSVALDGDVALIGARSDFISGKRGGGAYVFQAQASKWMERGRFDGQGTWNFFGSAAGLSGDQAIVGAPADGPTYWRGAAYLFDLDVDRDGLLLGAERTRGTDPRSEDTDEDGLDDGDEIALGTDPLDPDTDHDDLNDGAEVSDFGSDPLDPDSDNDGLRDGPEVLEYGTDPLDTDSDDDGVRDGEEVYTHGTNPATYDTDGDGQGDGYEISRGSDPNDARSFSTPAGSILLPIPLPAEVPEF